MTIAQEAILDGEININKEGVPSDKKIILKDEIYSR